MKAEDDWQRQIEQRLRALEERRGEHCPSLLEEFACTVLNGFVVGLAITIGLFLLFLLLLAPFLLLAVLDMMGIGWARAILQAVEGWLAG